MASSDSAEATVQEIIEVVDVKEKPSLSHQPEWHLLDNHQQNFSFTDVHPVNITVRNLQVEVEVAASVAFKARFAKPKVGDLEGSRRKSILKDVSADFPAGTLTAIIGGSGSGKTTFLNVLSNRMRGSNLAITGSTHYNGSSDLLTVTSAYVTQTDVLLPSLSVRETLLYAASLRLPSSTTSQQRSQLVEEIILELGLKDCADTRVGDGYRKGGCSGGERRRVSIGVQMLRNPSILFLDEPTTGLDATSAFHLVKTLKHLANTGRTIITTIHQPRSDIFFLFDRLTLLSRGNFAYTGPTAESLSWFDGLLPGGLMPHVNPADYLIDIVAVDTRTKDAEDESQARVNRLLVAWCKESEARFTIDKAEKEEKSLTPDDSEKVKRLKESAPFLRQVQVLTSRSLLTTIRDPFGLVAAWAGSIFMGLVCGLIFYKIPHTLAGIRSAQSAFYLLNVAHSYLYVLFEIYRLTRYDIPLFDRERGENLVTGVAWVVSRRIAHGILEDFFVPFLFCFIFAYLAGFQGNMGIFLAVVVLIHYIMVSFALFAVALLRKFAWAALMANLFATVQTYGAGFFVQAATIPVYVRWMKYISYFFYGFGAAAVNEFAGRYYDCPHGDARTDPACIQYRGSFILQNLSFSENWLTVPLCALLCFVGIFLVSSCFILQYWTVDAHFSAARTRNDDSDASAGKEVMKERDSVSKVDVELIDLALEISKPSLRPGKGMSLNVLQSVSTKFQAGELNVILGPSGSGKSSLLNTMARRLRSSLFTRYRTSGAMLFNGVQPTDKEVRSLCSYVMQDDGALLPYLTVRETLRFAAGLRLPRTMSQSEKMQRAEDVMLKMGLKDCADVLVGNELLKGISGGEKRRVSIAVQVLTEPQILILDEPTSGLDAFTASSIIKVLEGLAQEGRTVIATIHQSRSDLFPHFGNILLLAKGGQVAYSGKGNNILQHFASLGQICPSTTNPTDFALDIVSIDLREEKNEAVSRGKVENLIRLFAAIQESEKVAVQNDGSKVEERGLAGLEGRNLTPMYIAVPILIRRSLLCFKRQPDLALARIMQVVGLGIFIALFFAPLKRDYFSFQNRLGAIQQILAVYFVGLLQNVGQYPLERDAFYREYADRTYSVNSFFFVYLILEVPFEIASGLLFSLLVVAVNLQRTVVMYFLIALVCFCMVNCGESLGIIFNTFFIESTGFALNLTNSLLSIMTIMAGILSIDMPAFFKGINYASPGKYAAAIMTVKTFTDFEFTCTDAQRLPNGNCPIQTGQQVLDLFNYHTSLGLNIGALVAVTVVYRLIAYVVLRLAKADFGVARKEKVVGN